MNKENRWCPDFCPITGRPFFLWMNHPDLGDVPTYGGPYDSYTLAERDADGSYYTRRYDHDEGGWIMDEVQDCGVQVVEDWLPKNETEIVEYVSDQFGITLVKGV